MQCLLFRLGSSTSEQRLVCWSMDLLPCSLWRVCMGSADWHEPMQSDAGAATSWTAINADLWLRVFANLDVHDLLRCMCVCQQWKAWADSAASTVLTLSLERLHFTVRPEKYASTTRLLPQLLYADSPIPCGDFNLSCNHDSDWHPGLKGQKLHYDPGPKQKHIFAPCTKQKGRLQHQASFCR